MCPNLKTRTSLGFPIPGSRIPYKLHGTIINHLLNGPPAKRRGRPLYIGRVCISVWLYVCHFESLDVGSLYLHTRHRSSVYGSSSYRGLSSGQSQGHRSQKKAKKCLLPQCKTLVGNASSRSIKHRAVMFAYNMGFWGTADRVV